MEEVHHDHREHRCEDSNRDTGNTLDRQQITHVLDSQNAHDLLGVEHTFTGGRFYGGEYIKTFLETRQAYYGPEAATYV